MEETGTEIDPRHVRANVVRQPAVADSRLGLAAQVGRFAVDTRDQGASHEHSDSGRVGEEVMQTDRGDDLHAPQTEREPDAFADGVGRVAGHVSVREVDRRAIGDEGARDEGRGDVETVGNDLEQSGEPEPIEESTADSRSVPGEDSNGRGRTRRWDSRV